MDLIEANMRRLVETLTPFRNDIAAEDPGRAITFAPLSATTLIGARPPPVAAHASAEG